MMALVTNFLFQGLSGKVGNVVFKQRRGKTYVDPLPVYNDDRILTQKELEVRAKFAKAVAYARKAMSDPVLHEVYKKQAYRNKTAYGIAFRHALQSPVVTTINIRDYTGLPGSKILIIALDDVRVEEVAVSIVTADGILIEEGKAYLLAGSPVHWIYEGREVNNELEGCKVIVVAKNLPGNEGVQEYCIVGAINQSVIKIG